VAEANVKAYILAGGKGSRLSPVKGFLTVSGVPIIERVRAAAAPVVSEVVLVGDPEPPQPLGLRVITEEPRAGGPLAALCAALADAHPVDALVLSWDAPFLTTPLLAYLRDQTSGADAVVPRRGDLMEPLCAVYGPGCLAPARAAFDADQRSAIAFYDDVVMRWVAEDELAPFGPWERLFLNVNTPDDLERARQMADSAEGGAA